LLATTKFKHMNIHCYVDINSTFHNRPLGGKMIHRPLYIANHHLPVLISSYLRKDEIRKQLKTLYGYTDREIITL
jgi:hypothetical protein